MKEVTIEFVCKAERVDDVKSILASDFERAEILKSRWVGSYSNPKERAWCRIKFPSKVSRKKFCQVTEAQYSSYLNVYRLYDRHENPFTAGAQFEDYRKEKRAWEMANDDKACWGV